MRLSNQPLNMQATMQAGLQTESPFGSAQAVQAQATARINTRVGTRIDTRVKFSGQLNKAPGMWPILNHKRLTALSRFMDETISIGVRRRVTKKMEAAEGPLAVPTKILAGFIDQLTDVDFKQFESFGKFNLATPPGGMLLFILFPALLFARTLHAFYGEGESIPAAERKRNLKRSLVQDGLTSTLFVYLLKPVRQLFSLWSEQAANFPLLRSDTLKEMSLKHLADNYDMHHKENLLVNLFKVKERHFQWDGIRDAMDRMLPTWKHKPILQDLKTEFRLKTETLMLAMDEYYFEQAKQGVRKIKIKDILENKTLTKLAEEAFSTLDRYQEAWEAVFKETEKGVLPQAVNGLKRKLVVSGAAMTKRSPEAFLSRYAQYRSLPANVLSFLFVALAVGLLPRVVANTLFPRKTQAVDPHLQHPSPPATAPQQAPFPARPFQQFQPV